VIISPDTVSRDISGRDREEAETKRTEVYISIVNTINAKIEVFGMLAVAEY
jgi:hypothetical protein